MVNTSSSGKAGMYYQGFRIPPPNRDHPLKTGTTWILDKKAVDSYGDLWRIHDRLYNLSDFTKRHPGGEMWIESTRGTDITEAFESAHLNPAVEKLLDKFYVKNANSPRNSPYTFHDDGFYKVLKKRVYSKLVELGLDSIQFTSSVVAAQNFLLITFVVLFFLSGLYGSYWYALFAGLVLGMNVNCAHNFFHQRDNWRMYVWDLSLLSSYEWRITHGLSHHLYTNSIFDFELSDFEPFFDFKVSSSKSLIQRYGMVFLQHLLGCIFFFMELVKRVICVYLGLQKARPENFLPFVELAILVLVNGNPLTALKLWLLIHSASSYFFGFVGIIAAHHHPDIFHEGDDLKYGLDWGLCQMDAVRDRRDVNGVLLAELTMYGQHVLHHLFPTLDHGKLRAVETVFYETCKEFAIDDFTYISSPYTQWDLYVGMLQQLARTEPRRFEKKILN